METSKYKKEYLLINVPLITIGFVLLFSKIFIADITIIYYIGIIDRIILGIWCIFNGIWNFSTDYYSILKNKRFYKSKKTPRLGWLLLLIVGIGCIITAFMGYGFNNVHKPL